MPYEDTPLGILQAMLSLPTPPGTPTAGGAAAAGPSGSSGGGFGAAAATAGAAQGGSRGAAAGPGAAGADSRAVQGLDSGFAQRHNACVTAALQDAGVKVCLGGWLGLEGLLLVRLVEGWLRLKGVAGWGERCYCG